MKRGRLPLTALRSFEAAGRLASFTAAAEELHVSQAAVSRQIRELEELLGKPLFARRHRGVDLTPAGRSLLAVLTAGFDAIDTVLEDIRSREDKATVRVSSEPSFAACWLVPRLAGFQLAHPGIEVVLDADPRLIEFRTHEAELAIRHGLDASAWPRAESRLLFGTRVTPVLSPERLRSGPGIDAPGDLADYPLLHEENRDGWQNWLQAAGVGKSAQERGAVYSDSGLILQAALRGHGVALLDELFAAEALRSGELLQPFEEALPQGAYWLVARSFKALPPASLRFAQWLEAALQDDLQALAEHSAERGRRRA